VTGNEIREMFLRYFEGKDHRRVRSSSLVPVNDPTLLFTNAGMNQFKDVFLGLEQRDYRRAVSCQKCVRAGGKHNDLENVGFTNRHHTFFEMLGNFSFGDYFKKEAIEYAWELVTGKKWFAIDPKKLYATVFQGEGDIPRDDEAEKSWLQVGMPKERVFALDMKDNFWQMGDTGPCGPCSEIHYDMGAEASDLGHKDCSFPCDCGRYVEIWNLVFMQFNRDSDGKFAPLPKPCVDTGMGLERVAAVLQGKVSDYDTDLFAALMKRAAELCDVNYEEEIKAESGKGGAASLRVIADHARATTFLVADGVLPSNEGRGYVLRKIMRRAIRHGRLLGATKPFLAQMVDAVLDLMGDAYPELRKTRVAVPLHSRLQLPYTFSTRPPDIVSAEEKRFLHTLEVGLKKLNQLITIVLDETPEKILKTQSYLDRKEEEVVGPAVDQVVKWQTEGYFERRQIPGGEAFKLYDTFGLPPDFIQDAARDAGILFDQAGFDEAMQQQKKRARASWKGGAKEAANPVYAKLAETYKTEPDFYFATNTKDCHIEAIITKKGQVNELKEGEEGEVILDRTVIYAESGGQVSDTGSFYDNSESLQVAEVRGAYYPVTGLIAHKVLAKETLRVGDRVAVVADAPRREHVKRNHTGTHLVHAALRNILGTHVKQAGSLNAPDRLRFDFSHFAAVDPEELRDIEQQVNEHILQNVEMQTDVTSLDDALASGALAFFGDKYPEQNVRVVTIPDAASPRGSYSKELCGGTHVKRTGDIGVFKIVSEQSVAAGVRRIEAITGTQALADYQRALGILRQVAAGLNVGEDALLPAIEKLAHSARQLEKQLGEQKRKGALSKVDELIQQAKTVKGVKVVVAQVEEMDREALRQLVDSLRQKLGSGVVVLGTSLDGKAPIIVGVTKDLTDRLHAGKIAQILAQKLGGKGGGRPDLAEAGGKDTSALNSTLGLVPSLVEQML
jgi:alanyl-tRNA synthetase